jgi:hypothetical protein
MPSVLAALGVPGGDPLGLCATLDGVRRIAILLVDGLGWHQLGLAGAHASVLAEIVAGRLGDGRVASARSLTAGFPSTTPTSLVTLGTGVPPGAHGIVLFAHGSGSSRHNPRNLLVADALQAAGLATLLMDLLRRRTPDADVAGFRFRAVRPTFDLYPFRVNGEPRDDGTVRLWAHDHDGLLTMDATATLR